MGAIGGPGRSTELARGPTASTSTRVTFSLVAQVGSASSHPWLLAINTRGVRDYDTHTHKHTHTHTPHFLSSLALLA